MDSLLNCLKLFVEGFILEIKEDYLFECEYSVKERKFYKWNYCFIMLGYDYKEV